jgi:hypothetical protein
MKTKKNDTLEAPDERFAVRQYKRGRITVFVSAPAPPAHLARWRSIEGAYVILVGEVEEALRLLIDNYTTEKLIALLGLRAHTLHLLRKHLGMPIGATGRGGARPKAGRKKKVAEAG